MFSAVGNLPRPLFLSFPWHLPLSVGFCLAQHFLPLFWCFLGLLFFGSFQLCFNFICMVFSPFVPRFFSLVEHCTFLTFISSHYFNEILLFLVSKKKLVHLSRVLGVYHN